MNWKKKPIELSQLLTGSKPPDQTAGDDKPTTKDLKSLAEQVAQLETSTDVTLTEFILK